MAAFAGTARRTYRLIEYEGAADAEREVVLMGIPRPASSPSPAPPRDEAVHRIKKMIEKSHGRKGRQVVAKNFTAVDMTLAALCQVAVPMVASSRFDWQPAVPPETPEFVRRFTAAVMEGRDDSLPVSAMPVDGAFPTGTSDWEKRSIAEEVPVWEPNLCMKCRAMLDRRAAFGYPGAVRRRRQPARYLEVKAPRTPTSSACRSIYLAHPRRGLQFLEPLFEFSGPCAGCGETPICWLLSQLFGDRLQIAKATGCSSIYGGNLSVTP